MEAFYDWVILERVEIIEQRVKVSDETTFMEAILTPCRVRAAGKVFANKWEDHPFKVDDLVWASLNGASAIRQEGVLLYAQHYRYVICLCEGTVKEDL